MSQNLTDILASSLPVGPQGPTGPVAGSSFLYQFDASSESQGNPGSGFIRFNSGNNFLVSQTYVSLTDENFDSHENLYRYLNSVPLIITISDTNATNAIFYSVNAGNVRIISTATGEGEVNTYASFNVTYIDGYASFSQNANLLLTFSIGGGTGGGAGPSGPSGPSGATGAAGPSGPSGPQGDAGAAGPSGPSGPTGNTGPTGPEGTGLVGGLYFYAFNTEKTSNVSPTANTWHCDAPSDQANITKMWFANHDVAGSNIGNVVSVLFNSNSSPKGILSARGQEPTFERLVVQVDDLILYNGYYELDVTVLSNSPGNIDNNDNTGFNVGMLGNDGPSGPSGATGAAGPSGPSGPSGPQGDAGAAGPSGPSGPSGPQGDAGAAGPSGPSGATGAAGPSGPSGPSGAGSGGYVLVTANTGSQVNSQNINFVNTSTVTVSVVSGDNGNANVSFTSVGGGLPLANGTSNVNIATANGNVTITANSVTYTFDTTGKLRLPYNVVLSGSQNNSIAFGVNAGNSQWGNAIAIGTNAGELAYVSNYRAVAIGLNAGNYNQANDTVAIGAGAGKNNQSEDGVAIGFTAGQDDQRQGAVAVGNRAGQQYQGNLAVAVGDSTGVVNQGNLAIAIGSSAGLTNQGRASIAIGASAGETNQGNNSIILNATGSTLNQTVANTLTIAPIRNETSNTANILFYNANTKEVSYHNSINISGTINATTLNVTTANVLNVNGRSSLAIGTGTGSNGNVLIHANGVEVIRVTNVGRVGVFSTTPNSNVVIVGNAWVTTNLTVSTNITTATINVTTANLTAVVTPNLTATNVNVTSATIATSNITVGNVSGNLFVGGSITTGGSYGDITGGNNITSNTFTANANIQQVQYTLSTVPGNIAITEGSTVNINNFSGMIIINNWTSGGIQMWLVGGGAVGNVGNTLDLAISNTGSITHSSPNYVWTAANTATYSFTTVKTRDAG